MSETPIGTLKELPTYKGYFVDETYALFTYWRIIWGQNEKSGREYVAQMIRTVNWFPVELAQKTQHKKRCPCYQIVKRRKARQVSRVDILTEARRGPKPRYLAIHIDGNAENDDPENLKWGTWAEYCLVMRGGAQKMGKLSYHQKKKIKKRLEQGYAAADLAREYGVSAVTISHIKNGRKNRTKPKEKNNDGLR